MPIYVLFHILFYYGLSQDAEYSSLCCTVGVCCLSILYNSLPLLIPDSHFYPLSPLWQLQVYSLYLCVCFCFIDMLIWIIF